MDHNIIEGEEGGRVPDDGVHSPDLRLAWHDVEGFWEMAPVGLGHEFGTVVEPVLCK